MNDLAMDRLSQWARVNLSAIADIELTKFAGGQSNPTYRMTDGQNNWVLRRKPFGNLLPSAHAIEREYRLLHALEREPVPVPRAIALCDDDTIIGAPFYVMEMVDGRIFTNGTLPDLDQFDRPHVYRAMIAGLGALHRIDPASVGMQEFGKPGNYFERQVRLWTKQYHAGASEPIREIDALIEWLPKTVPASCERRIIHGDYRIDNLIFDRSCLKLKAIIDWELATVGDPLADLSYFLMHWIIPCDGRGGIGGTDLASLNIPEQEEMLALYLETTERHSVPALNWYLSYNIFRLVCIMRGIQERAAAGNAANDRAEELAHEIEPLAKKAWEFAQLAAKHDKIGRLS